MSYPNSITSFTTKIDKNASGYLVGPEYFNVPSITPYELYLDHVPTNSKARTVGASGGATWTEVLVSPTSTSQYLVDYTTGKITFNSGNAGAAVQAQYYCLGDDIMAEHVNVLQTEVTSIENELGANSAGSYLDVATRLSAIDVSVAASGFNGSRIVDNTVRAGALMADIKGSTWSSTRDVLTDISAHVNDVTDAHDATAISIVAPGTTSVLQVQGHVDLKGAANQTPTNPHGMAFSDLVAVGTDLDMANQNITAKNVQAAWIGVSGNINTTSSGTYDIGAANRPFASGVFQNVYIATSPTENQHAATKYYVDAAVLTENLWDRDPSGLSPHTPGDDIVPNASGTQNVGTKDLTFKEGVFNTVTAFSGFKTGDSSGGSGSFTSADGKTITVKNGIIVSIV